jgi:glycosyltransferase involved in cell wall biosynthesis
LLSESLYADIAKFVELEQVTFISNAVETPSIHEQKKSDVVSFLYLANLDARKGVFKALDVFREFSKSEARATLKIVGAGTVFLSESDLAKQIADDYPEISERVHILGALYGEDKERAFIASDIFLYPTEHDAAPLVVLEALSYALPVVCSNQGALRDMVDHGAGGFVIDTFNVNSYFDAISIILSNYEQFSKSARDTHLKKHSISALSSKVKRLFYD